VARGKHTSIEKNLRLPIRRLEALPSVAKLVFGEVENCRHKFAAGTIRVIRDAPGGLHVRGYGGAVIMDIFVKTSEPEAVRAYLEA
jgi:hypothetical protein